ncbi:PIN domain-containing protein [Streptomyces scabiei]|uniref:PIN domain-containing protein n=1 Tax=Streptomyces scabiei TaxID=1930 RepID=UPI00298F462D|nr:PIN domain-containing protein [Streptomyces scabiei]MDW8807589.1 PIN domain-containing protein [Streptomyces scabiei]
MQTVQTGESLYAMQLRDVGMADSAELTLTQLKYKCQGIVNTTAVVSARDSYLSWVEEADRHFRSVFSDDIMADDLYTPAYWEIRRIVQATPRPYPLIRGEIENQVRRIDAALVQISRARDFASQPGTVVVTDTSAFIQGEIFTDFAWPTKMGIKGSVRLVVPIIVVEQLDELKDTGHTTAGDKARKVLKRFREKHRAAGQVFPAPVRDKVTIEVLLDDDKHQRLPIADDEIIRQALKVQQMVPGDVMLACVDASMEFRALAKGLKVFEVPPSPRSIQSTS